MFQRLRKAASGFRKPSKFGKPAKPRSRVQLWLEPLDERICLSGLPPVAVADSYATHQGETLNVIAPGTLGNDTDAEQDTLTAEIYSFPSHGYLVLNQNGSFDYVPDSGFVGTDSFEYRAFDGSSYSNIATITIDVTNQAPVANNDYYWAPVNGQLAVSSTNGVLANDTDPDGDALTAELYSSPYGYLEFNSDGSFTYVPNMDFQGDDAFSYRVFDGAQYSAVVLVSLAVAPDRVFTVNYIGDTLDVTPGDGWARDNQHRTSLRAAIMEANAFNETDFEIRFDPALNGQTITLGIELPNLNKTFTISGLGVNDLTIRRNPAAVDDFRIFTINAGKEVEIKDLGISNGRAFGQDEARYGGAIYNAGTLTLSGVGLRYNEASSYGGAIYNAPNADLTMEESNIWENQAERGGGIYNAGEASISFSYFYGNRAAHSGGGICNDTTGNLTLVITYVEGNTAVGYGGGIANFGGLDMYGGSLLGNWVTVDHGLGGGLFNPGGTAYLDNVDIKSNRALGTNGKGGGIYVNSGTVIAFECTFEGNLCGLQGGGSNGCWMPGATLTRTNCEVLDGTWAEDPNP